MICDARSGGSARTRHETHSQHARGHWHARAHAPSCGGAKQQAAAQTHWATVWSTATAKATTSAAGRAAPPTMNAATPKGLFTLMTLSMELTVRRVWIFPGML